MTDTIIKHGDIENTISETYSVDQDGIITYTKVETMDFTATNVKQSDVQAMANTTDGTLRCTSCVVTQNDSGLGQRTTVYQGTNGTHYRYRLTVAGSQEPIQTHPDWDEIGGTGDDPQNGAIFKGEEEDSEFDYFPTNAEKDLGGVSGYLDMTMECEVTVVTQSGSMADPSWHSLYNNIAEIRTPIGGGAPAAPSGRDWLLTGTTQETIGGAIKAT